MPKGKQDGIQAIKMPKGRKRIRVDGGTTSFMETATTALQRKMDECDAFAVVTAYKFHKMSQEQRALAESLVLNVVNRGVQGNLSRVTQVIDVITPPQAQLPPRAPHPTPDGQSVS